MKRITRNKYDKRDYKICHDCQNGWLKTECTVKTFPDGKRVWQCNSCRDYDLKAPQRKQEYEEHQRIIKEMGRIDFPYMAGDPFW